MNHAVMMQTTQNRVPLLPEQGAQQQWRQRVAHFLFRFHLFHCCLLYTLHWNMVLAYKCNLSFTSSSLSVFCWGLSSDGSGIWLAMMLDGYLCHWAPKTFIHQGPLQIEGSQVGIGMRAVTLCVSSLAYIFFFFSGVF